MSRERLRQSMPSHRTREMTGGSLGSSTSARPQSGGTWAKQTQQCQAEREGRRESLTYSLRWRIEDVLELAAHVEGLDPGQSSTPGTGRGEEEDTESPSEMLRAGRQTVDGMYKFDLGVTAEEGEGTNDTDASDNGRRLSLFICCTALDVPAFTAELFVGIVGPHVASGREYGATPYLWSHSQKYDFCPNDDFVRIPLPVLSQLTKDPSVQPYNAFDICISIIERYGLAGTFQSANQVSVPTDLIMALGGLVDNPAGADVRFVCLEHRLEQAGSEDRRRVSSESELSVTPMMQSRKRVIYANSQILSGRSGYFADLFKGDFAESRVGSGSRYRTITVESADFDTVYGMLRGVFVYTNELLFDEKEDRVRELLRQQSIESGIAHRILAAPMSSVARADEWGWHNTSREDDLSSIDHDSHSLSSSTPSTTTTPLRNIRSPTAPTASSVAKATTPRPKHEPDAASPKSSVRTVGKGPHPARPIPGPDPHAHPSAQPSPACALSVYMLAHQYRLDVLQDLAKKHILSHLTHSTCIPVFLASHRYLDLHESVLEYIHNQWKDVKRDTEFVRCFQEVARGVWGEEGGTILADMVSRLPY